MNYVPDITSTIEWYRGRYDYLWRWTVDPVLKRFGMDAVEDQSEGRPTEEIRIDPSVDLSSLSEHELYVLTQNLKDEEASKRPLISSTEPLSKLREEYENGGSDIPKKIDWLQANEWKGIRRTRGDGDCFYRSLAYSYVERIMHAEDAGLAVAAAKSVLDRAMKLLEAAGFDRIAYEDFYETFLEIIENIVKADTQGRTLNDKSLLEFFQTPELSNSVVVFLRLVTSAQMRADPSAFDGFLMHPDTYEPLSVKEFCERFVEATGKEADDPQIASLTRAMSISVNVAYLAGSMDATDNPSGEVNFVKFEADGPSPSGALPVTLLYRPGHYDILEVRPDDSEPLPKKQSW